VATTGNVQQLILQVDASVELAKRNVAELARSVVNDTGKIETALDRVDAMFNNFGKGMKAGSAEASAQVFVEGFAKAEAAANKLLASIDPLFAAEQRYINQLEEANNLHKIGAMSAQRLAQAQAGLKAQYDQEVASLGRVNQAAASAAREENELAMAADRLRSRLDPLHAVQQRHNADIQMADRLLRAGKISWQEYGQEVSRAAAVLSAARGAQDATVVSMQGIERTSGQVRLGMQNLSFQINDVATMWALGARPAQIFASQIGQITAAMQMMGGEGSKWARFLGGPWGVALSLAATALTVLVARHKEAEDSVSDLIDKMRKQAEQAYKQDIANKVWEDSIYGIIDAHKKLREEIDKANVTETIGNRIKVIEAEQRLTSAREKEAAARKKVAELEASVAAQERAVTRASQIPNNPAGVSIELGKLDNLKKKLAGVREELGIIQKTIPALQKDVTDQSNIALREYADTLVDGGRALDEFYQNAAREAAAAAGATLETSKAVSEVAAATREVAGVADKSKEAARAAFDTPNKITALIRSFQSGKTPAAEFAKSMLEIAASLRAVAAAAKNTSDATRQLPKVTNKEVSDLVKEVFGDGTRITSTFRTPAQNKAAGGAANSHHLKRNGAVDFIPEGGMSAFDKGRLQEAAAARGIKVRELFGPGDGNDHEDHGHIAFDTKRMGPDQVAKERDRLAQRGIRIENRFEEQMERLNGELLAAKMELVADTTLEAEFAAQRVKADADRQKLAIQNDVEEGKLKQADADLLKAKVDEVANQKLKTVETRKQIELAKEQFELDDQRRKFAIDELRWVDEKAKTASEHRRIQLSIIDLVYEQRKKELEYLKLQAERNGNLAEATRIQGEIDNLPREQDRDRERAKRDTRGPLEERLDKIPRTAEEMNEAFQRIADEGLQAVEDGIMAVISGAESLGDAFKRIVNQIIMELARIAIQKAIIGPLANALGGAFGSFGTTGAGGGIGGSGGGGVGGGIAGARASGGPVDRGLPYLVGERGPEIIVPKSPGVVIPNHRILSGGGGAGGDINVTVHAEGAVLRDEITKQVAAGMSVAMQGGADLGHTKTLKKSRRVIP
jgi:hypothetical protein